MINTEDRWERQKRISGWNQNLLKESKILVVGAGTLGNEVCKNLALLGVGNVTIIDYDIIEEVNLSRSILMRQSDIGKNKAKVIADRMNELYNDINVTAVDCNIIFEYGCANYKDFNIVIMTVDNREARLCINKYCYIWSVPLINGGLDGLSCSVQVIIPPHTACYECTFTDHDYENIRKKYSCSGFKRDVPEGKIPMVITSAAIAGGIIVQEAVKIIHNFKNTFAGKKVVIDGNTNEFEIINMNINNSCYGHFSINLNDLILLDYSIEIKLSELKKLISNFLNINEIEIEHDRAILYIGKCPYCNYQKKFLKLVRNVFESEFNCDRCGGKLTPEDSGILKEDDKTLKEHGVPDKHLLTLHLGEGAIKYLIQK